MKARIIIGLILISPILGFSQGEFNNWYFGNYKAVTFNSGYPVLLGGSDIYAGGVTVNVSDSSGNILFYSDGTKVYNRLNVVMPHGTGLSGGGGSFSQSITTVQDIEDDSAYYLFTAGRYAFNNPSACKPASYSVLNMRLNGGTGDIVPMLTTYH